MKRRIHALSNFIYRVQGISLKWKLLIPFLLFSLIGTMLLVYIGLSSQQDLIRQQERKQLLDFYHLFITRIGHKGDQLLAMATIVAKNSRVQELLAGRNLGDLRTYLLPLHDWLKRKFGIYQFHFHVPPGQSFLRVHAPEMSGEMTASYRKAIMDVMKSGKDKAGLDWGLTGLSIRGMVPVYHKGVLVGTFEIGYPFGRPFLEDLKKNWGPDFSVFDKKSEKVYQLVATTTHQVEPSCSVNRLKGHLDDKPIILIAPAGHPASSILVGPVRDYLGEVVGIVEINASRAHIIRQLARTRNLMIVVGIAGIIVSFALIWVVATLFTRPIKEIVIRAKEIAEGEREARLKPRPDDEIGRLTQSLNTMLDSLKERQQQIQDYARTLERKVEERTADLVFSEEKYRTLVENLPLCVYRILADGTTEFVNPYFTDKLGYTTEEVVSESGFWERRIWGCDKAACEKIWQDLREDAKEFRVERMVKDKEGRGYTFIDHAIPSKDDAGNLKWLDGIMMDITMLKRLQEMTLQTEEIKLLGEISARFAHEMRNPLVTAGGFARRLRDALPENDRHRKFANIIVEEVARLEYILKAILSSIEPFTLSVSEVDFGQLIQSSLDGLCTEMATRGLHMEASLSSSCQNIQADGDLLQKALDSLLKHSVLSMRRGDTLFVSTERDHDNMVLTIRHRAVGLGEDDLEHFFFPRLTGKDDSFVHDLPLSKIIVHRHGGKIDVFRHGEDVALKIELPVGNLSGATS